MKQLQGLLLLLLVSFSSVAYATEKHALVIGNGSYRIGALKNPVNDAKLVAQTLRLKTLGFKVTELHNRNLIQMDRAIRNFSASIKPGSVAVIYFAGHGMQYDGDNYLIPIGIQAQYEDELPRQAISTGFIMKHLMHNSDGLNVVILDACRNNPLQKRYRTAARGLTRVGNTPPNTMTIFATGPDQVADDNVRGNNGLFTHHLVQHMKQPGLDLSQMMGKVRKAVRLASKNKQIPFTSSSLEDSFCFAGCGVAAKPVQNNVSEAVVAKPVEPAKPLKPTLSNVPAKPQPVKNTNNEGNRFRVNGDGTVSDTKTGLMWKQCSEGLSGRLCNIGSAQKYPVNDFSSLKDSWFKNPNVKPVPPFAGHKDWRVPTREELRSLVVCSNGVSENEAREFSCGGENNRIGDNYSTPTTHQSVFPNTMRSVYWSSTPLHSGSAYASVTHFGKGNSYNDNRYQERYLRFVRIER